MEMKLGPMWDEGVQGRMEGPVQAYHPAVPQFAQGLAFELRFSDSQE